MRGPGGGYRLAKPAAAMSVAEVVTAVDEPLRAPVRKQLDAALEFLLDLVRTESLNAEGAIEAILRSMPSQDVTNRLEKLVKGNQRLARIFATHKKVSS